MQPLIQVLNEICFLTIEAPLDFSSIPLSTYQIPAIPTSISSFEFSDGNITVFFEHVSEESGSHTYGTNHRISFRLKNKSTVLISMTNSGPWLYFDFKEVDSFDQAKILEKLSYL